MLVKKHLIKDGDKIYVLTEDKNELLDITNNIADVNSITQLEYETYGMDDIVDLTVEKNKVDRKLIYQKDLEDGKIYKNVFNRSELPNIENIEML